MKHQWIYNTMYNKTNKLTLSFTLDPLTVFQISLYITAIRIPLTEIKIPLTEIKIPLAEW